MFGNLNTHRSILTYVHIYSLRSRSTAYYFGAATFLALQFCGERLVRLFFVVEAGCSSSWDKVSSWQCSETRLYISDMKFPGADNSYPTSWIPLLGSKSFSCTTMPPQDPEKQQLVPRPTVNRVPKCLLKQDPVFSELRMYTHILRKE